MKIIHKMLKPHLLKCPEHVLSVFQQAVAVGEEVCNAMIPTLISDQTDVDSGKVAVSTINLATKNGISSRMWVATALNPPEN